MIGQSISHYRIIGELGKGAMGVVYVAEHIHLKRRVAIKTLKAEAANQHYRKRFLREACAVSKLNHPNIAHVYDYGETPDGKQFIVMELVQGHTLAEHLSEKKLTLSRVLQIIGDVAKALAEAHRHGIIHRDIKPSNIIINERGEVKVLDFGLAKNINTDSSVPGNNAEAQALLSTQTSESAIVGTPLYLSPEQALGLPVDSRSDLFSLGSLLYECAAGRPTFHGKNVADIRAKVIRDDPVPPSHYNASVSAELDRIILKALAKRPESRYQTAEELLADLRATRAGLQSDARVPRPRRAPLRPSELRESAWTTLSMAWRRPRRLAAIFLIALTAGLVVWGAALFLRRSHYEPTNEAKTWYKGGVNALRDGTFYKASRMLEQATRLDEKFALAHARLAEAWSELGYTDKANTGVARANTLVMDGTVAPSKSETLYLQAVNSVLSRDFARAVKSYHAMLQEIPDEERPYVLIDLGRAYEKNEEVDKAVESYEEATKGNSQLAAAFLRVGTLYARQQKFELALATLDEAHRLYQAQSNLEGVTEVLYQRGVIYVGRGEVARAREELEHALGVARALDSRYQHIRTLLQLSRIFSTVGNDKERAKQLAVEAIESARADGINNLAAQGLVDLGNAFLTDKIGEAEKNYQQALELARAHNLRGLEARALLALGSLYVYQDDADRGLQHIAQALPFYEQNHYRTEVLQALGLSGQAYGLKGDYTSALQSFRHQLQLASQWGNPSQMVLAQKSIGTTLAFEEKYTEALEPLGQSYSISNALGLSLYAGYSLTSRADVLWRLGSYQDARAALSQATALAEQPDLKRLWGRIHLTAAAMALSERRFPEAVARARRAVAADDSQKKHLMIEAESVLGLSLLSSGKKSEARRVCEEARSLASRTGDPRLLSAAQLALAEVLLETGDAQGALASAEEARQAFERMDMTESGWRAYLITGRANQLLGQDARARADLSRAAALLSTLPQRWGTESFNSYLNRPDVRHYHTLLNESSAALIRIVRLTASIPPATSSPTPLQSK